MNEETHPVANRALHARAERAALEVYLSATCTRRRLVQLMDRAAAKVFRNAGTPTDEASFYAGCVTCLVLERVERPGREKISEN